MEVSFPKAGSIGLGVLSFVVMTENTFVGQFLRWLPFGFGWFAGILDFLVHYYAYLGSLFFMFIFLGWTRNVYVLTTLGIMFILFVKFGLQQVSVS